MGGGTPTLPTEEAAATGRAGVLDRRRVGTSRAWWNRRSTSRTRPSVHCRARIFTERPRGKSAVQADFQMHESRRAKTPARPVAADPLTTLPPRRAALASIPNPGRPRRRPAKRLLSGCQVAVKLYADETAARRDVRRDRRFGRRPARGSRGREARAESCLTNHERRDWPAY